MFLFAPFHVHARGKPMIPAVSLWSEFMLRKAPAFIDFSDLFSFLAHPHRWAQHYPPHSVTVTCKDTCGVTEAVCSGWITPPEIDQPSCAVSVIVTVSPLLLVSPLPPDQTSVGRDGLEWCVWIKGHFHLMSSKNYMLYFMSVVAKPTGIKGRGLINLTWTHHMCKICSCTTVVKH